MWNVCSRVFLCPLDSLDAPLFFSAVEISRKMLEREFPWASSMQTISDARRHIRNYQVQKELGNGALYGIFEKPPKENSACEITPKFYPKNIFCGAIYIHWISESRRTAELGYWLSEPFCGKGLALEALTCLSQHLLSKPFINRLEVHTAKENVKSISLLTRAGFLKEGLCREYEWTGESYRDHFLFSLLQSDLRE